MIPTNCPLFRDDPFLIQRGKMKLALITIALYLFLLSCVKDSCDIFFTDLLGAIKEGKDCNTIASCGNGGVDENLLKLCLKEKEKLKTKNK